MMRSLQDISDEERIEIDFGHDRIMQSPKSLLVQTRRPMIIDGEYFIRCNKDDVAEGIIDALNGLTIETNVVTGYRSIKASREEHGVKVSYTTQEFLLDPITDPIPKRLIKND